MHTHERCHTVLLAAVPLTALVILSLLLGGSGMLASITESPLALRVRRSVVQEEVQEVGKVAMLTKSAADIAKDKRQLRIDISKKRRKLAEFRRRHGINLQNPEEKAEHIDPYQEEYSALLSYLAAKESHLAYSDKRVHPSFLKEIAEKSAHQLIQSDRRRKRFDRSHADFLLFLRDIDDYLLELDILENRHKELVADYDGAQFTLGRLHRAAHAEPTDEVREILAEVEHDVYRMQSQLRRIDARLRRQAERTLIEKGLMSARPGQHSKGYTMTDTAVFLWPVHGVISAGYQDEDYHDHFGFEHDGIDIAVVQGTPVRSAATGIVFVARDGGETGYSYVIVAHRSGYATLYGHLFEIHVEPGQEISAGEIIGLSGGTPGTYGAGPFTTGAHLHFEVLWRGENRDPMMFL